MSIVRVPFSLTGGAAGGYVIQGSGLFDGSSGYLSWTPSSDGNMKTWVFECIYKHSEVMASGINVDIFSAATSAGANPRTSALGFDNGGLNIRHFNGSTDTWGLDSNELFRDVSAYYHVVVAFDTTQATDTNRIRVWVNGTEITSWASATWPTQNTDWFINDASHEHWIGKTWSGTPNYWDGYIARAALYDGLTITDPETDGFGETTADGGWQINDVSGLTFGTNGFLIEGGTNMAAGTDSSGNGNSFTKTGTITATNDSPTDDATNGYGNKAVINPLYYHPTAGRLTLSNGNRSWEANTGSYWQNAALTIPVTSGKWIVACSMGDITSASISSGIGLSTKASFTPGTGGNAYPGGSNFGSDSIGILDRSGVDPNELIHAIAGTTTNTGTQLAAADQFVIALDADSGKAWLGWWDDSASQLNWFDSGGTSRSTDEPGSGTNATLTYTAGTQMLFSVFAITASPASLPSLLEEADWSFTKPTGFLELSTENLPAPDVANYEDEYYIEAGISHTNGSTTAVTLPKSVSGGAMVRIKRTDSTGDWYVVDTVRGANNFLLWNTSATEDTSTFTDAALSGTTLTLPSALATGTYFIEVFYVSEFFQIKTWTGTTAAQTVAWDTALDSFGAIWNKPRSGTGSGIYFQEGNATGDVLFTDNAAAETARANYSQDPDATDFRLEADATAPDLNTNGVTYVAYGWANSGPYRFGSYTGNNDNDGPVVDGGGPPQLIFRKGTSVAQSWTTAVWPVANGNGINKTCYLDTSAAISGGDNVDLISTGFKIRQDSSGTGNNASATYAYGMFGIQPFGGDGVEQARAQ